MEPALLTRRCLSPLVYFCLSNAQELDNALKLFLLFFFPQWNFRIPQNSAMGLIAESFNLERTSSDQLVQPKQGQLLQVVQNCVMAGLET